MPMVGDALGELIKANIDAVGDKTDRDALFKAMGNAIVDYITTNALVTVAVTSVSAVTVGTGTSGPGAGTGTIT
jgi:hypothetical protein